jgi:translocation and assembly module TamA
MRRGGCFLAILLLVTGPALAARPEVVIDPGGVPPAALTIITEAVGVIARQAEDQDGGEADRLRRRARDATLAALATQGYFAAQVTLAAGRDIGGDTWDIGIQPGRRAQVVAVDLDFTGRVTAPAYAARLAAMKKAWLLPTGKPFVNNDWSKAKTELLEAVSRKDFLLARITASAADVDADTAQVRLKLSIDSGPLVKMGDLRTTGLKRVPENLVTRYVNYTPGAAYDQDKLDEWQQDLQGTNFFRGAFVSLGRADPPPDPNGEVTLPVQVRVVESPARRFSASLGLDSDVGVRAEGQYRQNVVFGLPLTMETGVGVDRVRQRAYADFYLPPDGKGNKDSFGLLVDHNDVQGLDVKRFAIGATRVQTRKAPGDSRVEYETRWGLLAAHDHVTIDGGDEYDLPTATATVEWLRRDVNSKYDPREGNLISVGGGVGAVLDSGEPFARLRLRGQKWWPIGPRDVFTTRAEVGKLWATSDVQVPDDFGFRAGGARSIRGYSYQSIGTKRADATVGAPTLAVASVEYDHYFNDRFGIAYFVDAGDAAESFGSMQMHVGYGVGARVRTPAGPLFLDLAYGQRDSKLRLSFSLGLAF